MKYIHWTHAVYYEGDKLISLAKSYEEAEDNMDYIIENYMPWANPDDFDIREYIDEDVVNL